MDSIKKLAELFGKFPGIGKRTAGRFVYYLINQPKENIDGLIAALQELKNAVKLCEFCFNPFENNGPLCGICQSPARSKNILCIVEKESDLLSIENTKKYTGLYFILGGTLTLRKSDGSHLRIEALKNRVKGGSFTEIIVALNPTPEGKSTSVLVERALKEGLGARVQGLGFKITHLAQGLPVGGELEYADEETLESAFEGRK
ncbi:MAG: recombination protein RecR [Candidatus Staskawiczbacteria bacterium RIFCSPHIGHO2_02_FULL_43_16]|uniref:Recombination protein RecR n=1 Tax=Candidatus Staskawiczbacteria bacterium RIFCSPHIGHO2_01_FULL_41_41 TaxID=1802203 RepID=A0A1G2HUW1_9BACT|nr:MAG: recombination protein RecR [Candidatus Staskawiczbacteria bacterium RIFCSPHIGHO2_01_FULL_41_41]OGZ68705.1 MAG: recombination protein RecR [Candidatus Staskawiczbacteria bacterium RIFCSPHIGHO2_02_FULL_43_16]OGZ75168.1 MAG: recombination protein RecR [Candidatus Staskawiczbacteria bacterium RIFCSPLOWO2_01_FULL_43_17b]